MNHPTPFAAAVLSLAAACATHAPTVGPGGSSSPELAALQVSQRMFREQNSAPIDLDFVDHGRVTVREVSLDGWPGGEYVRCRFHYQNRTARPVVKAWVSLDVLDPQGSLVSSQSVKCIVPVPMPIARGAYYSDELRTPTYGAHLQPGWTWRIRCTATPETEEEPLDPPVPERLPRQWAPLVIKNRGQNDA